MTEYIDGQDYDITVRGTYRRLYRDFVVGEIGVDANDVIKAKKLLVWPRDPWSVVTLQGGFHSDVYGNPPFQAILTQSENSIPLWRNVNNGGTVKISVMELVSVDRVGLGA